MPYLKGKDAVHKSYLIETYFCYWHLFDKKNLVLLIVCSQFQFVTQRLWTWDWLKEQGMTVQNIQH